jgi:ribosomal protein S18 acetylase RimI-like enzyme/catechol 2,3-dioxygenase-like lactoylglutathione lyase family enzyme
MDVFIRRLLASDAEAARDIRLEALKRCPVAFSSSYEDESAQPLGWFSDKLETVAVFGAFASEKLVGTAGFAPQQGRKLSHKGVLWGVYVRPEARGGGVARLLVQAVVEHARTQVKVLLLSVVRENKAARRLYASCGFRAYGVEPFSIMVDGVGHDEELMVLCFDQVMQEPRLNALVPELCCSNVDSSIAFYSGVLGFEILYQRPEARFAMMEREGAQIMLDELVPGSPRSWLAAELEAPFGRGVNLEIETVEIDKLYDQVRACGAKVFLPMEEMWYRAGDVELGGRQFIVLDPDGYLLRFAEKVGTRAVKR